jgi:hypothetical protein
MNACVKSDRQRSVEQIIISKQNHHQLSKSGNLRGQTTFAERPVSQYSYDPADQLSLSNLGTLLLKPILPYGTNPGCG